MKTQAARKPPKQIARHVLALNPLKSDLSDLRTATRLSAGLSRGANQAVDPVFVLSPRELHWNEFYPALSREPTIRDVRAKLQRALGEPSPAYAEAQVLFEDTGKLGAEAIALSRFAKKKKADFILTAGVGRNGPAFGSFVEALLRVSRIPVLCAKKIRHDNYVPRKILFASDLSPASLSAFRALLKIAAKYGSSVELRHFYYVPTPWAATVGGLYLSDYRTWRGEEMKSVRARLAPKMKLFEDAAQKAGVVFAGNVLSTEASMHERIVFEARRVKADWIALGVRERNSFGQLFGTLAARVVAKSDRPVWLCRG